MDPLSSFSSVLRFIQANDMVCPPVVDRAPKDPKVAIQEQLEHYSDMRRYLETDHKRWHDAQAPEQVQQILRRMELLRQEKEGFDFGIRSPSERCSDFESGLKILKGQLEVAERNIIERIGFERQRVMNELDSKKSFLENARKQLKQKENEIARVGAEKETNSASQGLYLCLVEHAKGEVIKGIKRYEKEIDELEKQLAGDIPDPNMEAEYKRKFKAEADVAFCQGTLKGLYLKHRLKAPPFDF